MAPVAREEQQTHVLERVARQDDDPGLLDAPNPIRVDVLDAVGVPVATSEHPNHLAASAQVEVPGRQRLGYGGERGMPLVVRKGAEPVAPGRVRRGGATVVRHTVHADGDRMRVQTHRLRGLAEELAQPEGTQWW